MASLTSLAGTAFANAQHFVAPRCSQTFRKRVKPEKVDYDAFMLGNLIEEIASDEVLEQAYQWLCERRRDYSHNDEVWEVRYRWAKIKPLLQAEIIAGRYRFSPQKRIHRTEDDLEIWAALDSLVLKAMAIVLTKHRGRKPTET